MKRISLLPHSVERLRKDYTHEHSKFIHSSFLLLEDLDKTFNLNNKSYQIVGLWDTIGFEKIILLADLEDGGYSFAPSKMVARAMGIYNMRNLVNGKILNFRLKNK